MEPGVPPQLRRTTSDAANLLGKYQLGRLLGRGSFAKVYEARSLADDSTVAVKVIDKSKTDPVMHPRIICEVATMRRLQNHPNILKIHEVMATKSKIYLIMEYAAGGELFAKLRRARRFNEPTARRYFQQLVSALHFCHQNGIAHRDVKPQNLLLDQDGNLKVSDFGLSALPEQLKNGLLHTSCGTPAYTAPEVACRRGGYDGSKADAWSCGVMLFVMLAGSLPFDDSNLAAMYKKIHRRDYEFPAWIPKSARNLIYKLLDPNPNSRMSIETLMETSWFIKSLKLTHQNSLLAREAVAAKFDMVPVMNAFDIISLSSGLDLSALFEPSKTEKRFTSMAQVEHVLGRVKEIGGSLGYRVEEGKGGTLGLGKGKLVLLVEVLEVAPSLLLVEVKVVDGGADFEELHWPNIKSGLQDIVLTWHNDAI